MFERIRNDKKCGGQKASTILLAGNPNVGKSTIFNHLTGMHQHTGNWTGKTVSSAKGTHRKNGREIEILDIPGTYSLFAHSPEEEVARDEICFGEHRGVVVVCDATCLERNLNLVLQILEVTPSVILCVNLLDEAKRKHITPDLLGLSRRLGIPVVGCVAHKKRTLRPLVQCIENVLKDPPAQCTKVNYGDDIERAVALLETALSSVSLKGLSPRWVSLRCLSGDDALLKNIEDYLGEEIFSSPHIEQAINEARATLGKIEVSECIVTTLVKTAERIALDVVKNKADRHFDHTLDKLLTGKKTAFPFMLCLLGFILWLTVVGANHISDALSFYFSKGESWLFEVLQSWGTPEWLYKGLVLGVYRVTGWVVAVMLPPMAIFFPLFTLLEDIGYLPRMAYNLDRPFARCNACGKQALTMCMGLGCNAVGIMGCRIIQSPRERLLAMLTNTLTPCNGRFPLLFTLSFLFFSGGDTFLSALCLLMVLLLSLFMTFLVTKLLSLTFLQGVPSSFILELPPYRKPEVTRVLIRSFLDRTLRVLGRAVMVAAPAGLVLYLLANITVRDGSLLFHLSCFLDPFAELLGMDGTILLAFILAFPANEIVMPIILMGYLSGDALSEVPSLSALKEILLAHGWSWQTAISVMLFSLFHFPCSTSLLTFYRETKSKKWTVVAFLLPTLLGVVCCMGFHFLTKLW
ncbi:MAG: ferrous iron transport protein B [Clostridia bacterium]|nr:ferrous iron transport protein B [Clostridia bacterium]